MKEIETLKQLVYEKGLQTLLKRMEVVLSCRDLRTLTSNVIVSVTIVDMDTVVRKIYGSCYIPEKYRGYIVMDWSATQTEK